MTLSEHRRKPSTGFFSALAAASALAALILGTAVAPVVGAFNPSARAFLGSPKKTPSSDEPKLILIGGAPGTGKSTFGMSVALDQGILKCISTDTIRAVMRSFVAKDVSPALHRSSYAEAFEGDDPVRSWRETCAVFSASVESLVDDAIARKVGLVVEGVHIIPDIKLIQKWEEAGGVATGCLLQVSNPETHKKLLKKRGFITGNVENEEKKINAYERVRAIQDEMMRLADDSGWLRIEQRTEPDPLEMVASKLVGEFPDAHDVFAAAAASSSKPDGYHKLDRKKQKAQEKKEKAERTETEKTETAANAS